MAMSRDSSQVAGRENAHFVELSKELVPPELGRLWRKALRGSGAPPHVWTCPASQWRRIPKPMLNRGAWPRPLPYGRERRWAFRRAVETAGHFEPRELPEQGLSRLAATADSLSVAMEEHAESDIHSRQLGATPPRSPGERGHISSGC